MFDELGRWRVAVAALVAIGGIGVGVATVSAQTCDNSPPYFNAGMVSHAPAVSFNISYDATGSVVNVTHQGGAPLRPNNTDVLLLTVVDAERGETREYTLATDSENFHIQQGDSQTVTLDGGSLDEGDVLRVIWRNSWVDSSPFYCSVWGETTATSTLAKRTVGGT